MRGIPRGTVGGLIFWILPYSVAPLSIPSVIFSVYFTLCWVY